MAKRTITNYECKICGRKIEVERSGDVYKEPVFCCGLEAVEEGARQNSKTTKKARKVFKFPEEKEITEGSAQTIRVNKYERSGRAREECIRHWGTKCMACGIDFGKKYGKTAKGIIHVHHLIGLAKTAKTRKVDPKKDLVPVCPNCHAVLHLSDPPLTIARVRDMLKSDRS